MKATRLLLLWVVLPVVLLSGSPLLAQKSGQSIQIQYGIVVASAEVVAELQDEMLEEAEECVMAKRELSSAETDDGVDRALRKISILCDT